MSPQLRQRHREVLLHTGQHYDDAMSDQFFRELAIPRPDFELDVGSGPHGEQTARMLTGIERTILEVEPDTVLIYGDTNSTLAGALAAAKLHVSVAHVEAGLRSLNRRMPEEINRVIADQLSTLLFCPSEAAAAMLHREGITNGVHVVGDVMADTLALAADDAAEAAVLAAHRLDAGRYVLATIHRAENTDDAVRLRGILGALNALSEMVILPLHPRTRAAMARVGYSPAKHVHMIDPVGYRAMISLERHARVILTDSGGVQKEAYWLGVPCVTVRDETEWTETVANGWNVLAGTHEKTIVDAVTRAAARDSRPPLYQEGRAVANIVSILDRFVPAR